MMRLPGLIEKLPLDKLTLRKHWTCPHALKTRPLVPAPMLSKFRYGLEQPAFPTDESLRPRLAGFSQSHPHLAARHCSRDAVQIARSEI
jgi:hypothetical protein